MGKKMWETANPRKFVNHVTVHRPTARESVRTTGIPMKSNSINRYGNRNATQGFLWKEIAWPAARPDFKKEERHAYSGIQISPAWRLDREMTRRLILQ